ncbi:MAG: oligosaccharide flippase family protein [Bacteroidales bacterium]|nr:oligosaccharide flippase family protein [Bacteroidales bacterium]
MLKYITFIIKNKLHSGDIRIVKAKRNILYSFFLKGFSIIINLLLVPLTLNYLNPILYGIWITIFSLLSWLSFFDIGLGNGLRNKLAESLAKKDIKNAKTYISTSYALLSIIFLMVFVIFIISNRFINWTVILNAPANMANELSSLTLMVFSFLCIKFILQLIGAILLGDQKPALNNMINPLSNLLTLLIIYTLTKHTEGNLLYVGFVYSLVPLLIYFLFTLILFKRKYSDIKPSISYVNFSYARELFSLGIQFFFIQVASIILLSGSNLIITQLFGPESVTTYNIAYKYFSVIIMTFSIIITPFWSAITDAYHKEEYDWIKININKLLKVWLMFVLFSIILLLFSKYIIELWIGNAVHISFKLKFFMALWVILLTISNVFSFTLNGIGKIRLQLYSSIMLIISNIPLAILVIKVFNLGIQGILMVYSLSQIIVIILLYIQYNKIIKGSAKGIWNK